MSIVEKAWETVKRAGTAQIKVDSFTENFEWLYMDKEFKLKTKDIDLQPNLFPPYWAYYYRSSRAPSGTYPGLSPGNIADKLVSSIENFANGIVSNFETLTTGVTKVTNPPPVRSSSGGFSSGGGCACACACAGCACACAGGGR